MMTRQQFNATWKLGMGLAAVMVLTGAKGQGCGGIAPPPEVVAPECADGYKLEKTCSQLCAVTVEPNGTETEVCEPEICDEQCVPIDDCAPGYHLELVCGEPTDPPQLSNCGPSETPPPVPEECEAICVPDDACPPGHHLEVICDAVASDCGESSCEEICVPDDTCDPTLICGEALTCVGGDLYPTTCGPANCDEPIGDCEPKCDPTLVCGQAETCVDGVLYPTTCGPENCDEPIGDCDPGCDPTLICGDALTCVNGVLYPSTCGPANCDEPLGDC